MKMKMKNRENAFLKYWPWLLPAGAVSAAAGRLLGTFGMLPDFWMGFLEGSGCLLALLGAAMLIVSFAEKRKK